MIAPLGVHGTRRLPSGWISDPTGADNSIGYDGYVFSAEVGHYCVRFRWYDEELGRWLQRDPLGYTDGASLYQYGLSSPSNALDAFGLQPECCDCVAYARQFRNFRYYTEGPNPLRGPGWIRRHYYDPQGRRIRYEDYNLCDQMDRDKADWDARQHRMLKQIEHGASVTANTTEVCAQLATVVLVFVPGPEDAVFALVGAAKLVKVGGHWFRIGEGGRATRLDNALARKLDEIPGCPGATLTDHCKDLLSKRGWTEEKLAEVIGNPSRVGRSVDQAGAARGTAGQPATAYICSDSEYCVINDVTGQIFHISDRNDPLWKLDGRIRDIRGAR